MNNHKGHGMEFEYCWICMDEEILALKLERDRLKAALEKIIKALSHPDSEFKRVANESKEGQLVVIAFQAMRGIAQEALSGGEVK